MLKKYSYHSLLDLTIQGAFTAPAVWGSCVQLIGDVQNCCWWDNFSKILKLKDVTSVRIAFRSLIPGFAKVCLSCCWNKQRAISMLVFASQLLVSDPSCFRRSEHPLPADFWSLYSGCVAAPPAGSSSPRLQHGTCKRKGCFFLICVPGFQGFLSICFIFTSMKSRVPSKGAMWTYYKFFTRFLIWGGWKVTVVQGRFHWICIFPKGIEFNDIKNRFFYICTIYCLVEMQRKQLNSVERKRELWGLFCSSPGKAEFCSLFLYCSLITPSTVTVIVVAGFYRSLEILSTLWVFPMGQNTPV